MAQVVVSIDRAEEKQTIQIGSAVMNDIEINSEGVPEEERGGTAKQFLASSALYCFCAALSKALKTRGAEYERITGTATLETGVDEKKRARVVGIELEVTVHMDEDYGYIFDRVEKIMKQGCLVTASLHAAFPITYKLHLEDI